MRPTGTKQQKSFSRQVLPEVCSYFRVLGIKRAQGKPDASRIRWPCVQGSVERHTSIAVTTGLADIRLSLHDRLYGLCRICSGQPAASPVATRSSYDSPSGRTALPTRELGAFAPADFGFAVRVLPRPSCRPAADRFIRDRVPRPRDQTDMPEAVRVHRDPIHASDDGQRPSGPERFVLYTRRYHCVKRKLR